jgi:hypothetical protein
MATCLRLTQQRLPVTEFTRQLGLHRRSDVQTTIQRQALELVTEAFLRLARAERPVDHCPCARDVCTPRWPHSDRTIA